MALLRTRNRATSAWWANGVFRRDVERGNLPDFLLDDVDPAQGGQQYSRRHAWRRRLRWLQLPFAVFGGLTVPPTTPSRATMQVATRGPSGAPANDGLMLVPLLAKVVVRTSERYERAKRLLDVTGSAIGLAVLAPAFLVVALIIKREDGGPVIHRREIVGLGGRHVRAFKFRTMIVNADDYLRRHPELMREYSSNVKLRKDPRITRIGAILRRTSVDELPQLLNVLRGEMSLVGPRMIHPSERARYGAFACVRETVRPGITGLWQVSGRQEVSYAARITLDQKYLEERSFWFDLKILARTVGVLVHRYGAY